MPHTNINIDYASPPSGVCSSVFCPSVVCSEVCPEIHCLVLHFYKKHKVVIKCLVLQAPQTQFKEMLNRGMTFFSLTVIPGLGVSLKCGQSEVRVVLINRYFWIRHVIKSVVRGACMIVMLTNKIELVFSFILYAI